MIPPSWTGGDLCVRLALSLGHFLWQGTAIALLAFVALACLRRASSRARYGVSVIAMGLMALCLPLTFMLVDVPRVSNKAGRDAGGGAQLLGAGSETQPLEATIGMGDQWPSTTVAAVTGPRPVPAKAADGAERLGLHAFSQFYRWAGATWPHLSVYVVMCYLLGVVAMFGRLAFGLRGGARLRQISQPVHQPHLLEMLARQAKALGLSFRPAVAYCEKVVVPTVVGVVRPAILLPLSVLSGLRSEQVEALLAHELAHIRRFDHLVNLAQRVAEAVLFFHPVVWLISRRIRIEREDCCDDMVVASGGEAVAYAASLVQMAELSRCAGRTGRLAASAALTATRGPSGLRRRVTRLLGLSSREPLRIRSGWSFVLGLVLIGGLFTAAHVNTWAAQSAGTGRPNSEKSASSSPLAPALPEKPKEAPQPTGFATAAAAGEKEKASPNGWVGKCTGVVLDARGMPIAGAEVVACDPCVTVGRLTELRNQPLGSPVTTGADGGFSLDLRGAGENIIIAARKTGMALDWSGLRFYMGGEWRETLCLGNPTVLAGTVVDETGKPVASATVEAFLTSGYRMQRSGPFALTGPPDWLTTKTDANGAFKFSDIPGHAGAGLRVAAPGRAAPVFPYETQGGWMYSRFKAGQKDIRLVLPATGQARGRVLDPSGAPLSGVLLVAHRAHKQLVAFSCMSGPNGEFSLEGIEAGEYRLEPIHDKDVSASFGLRVTFFTVRAGEAAQVQVKAAETGVVEICVHDAATKLPVPGAQVVMYESGVRKGFSEIDYTGADGRLVLRAPAGAHRVVANGHGYQLNSPASGWRPLKVIAGTTQRMDFELRPYPSFAGIKRDERGVPRLAGSVRDENGRPAGGVLVRVMPYGTSCFPTDSAGRFDFALPGHASGDYVVARVPERNVVALATISGGGFKEMALKSGLKATGRVVGEDGAPIPVAQVRVLTSRERRGATIDMIESFTGPDGQFTIQAVVPPDQVRQYFVEAHAPGYVPSNRLEGRPANQRIVFGDISLSRADQAVSGIVVDAQGRPAPNISVSSVLSQVKIVSTDTDENGRFVLSGVGKGPLLIQADTGEKAGYRRVHGGDTDVRITLGDRREIAPSPQVHSEPRQGR